VLEVAEVGLDVVVEVATLEPAVIVVVVVVVVVVDALVGLPRWKGDCVVVDVPLWIPLADERVVALVKSIVVVVEVDPIAKVESGAINVL